MTNKKLRNYSKSKKVPLWKIADQLKISEATLTRKLRYELSEEERNYFFSIIDYLANEKKGNEE